MRHSAAEKEPKQKNNYQDAAKSYAATVAPIADSQLPTTKIGKTIKTNSNTFGGTGELYHQLSTACGWSYKADLMNAGNCGFVHRTVI